MLYYKPRWVFEKKNNAQCILQYMYPLFNQSLKQIFRATHVKMLNFEIFINEDVVQILKCCFWMTIGKQ